MKNSAWTLRYIKNHKMSYINTNLNLTKLGFVHKLQPILILKIDPFSEGTDISESSVVSMSSVTVSPAGIQRWRHTVTFSLERGSRMLGEEMALVAKIVTKN
jgi:hypothetical protein